MTAEDESERFAHAFSVLVDASHEIAQRFDVCPLCLIYALAELAEDAEERGTIHHRDVPRQTHPPHKTVL